MNPIASTVSSGTPTLLRRAFTVVLLALGLLLPATNLAAPPVANPLSVTAMEDKGKAITVTATDADPGSTLTYQVATRPAHGKLIGTGPTFVYVPFANYNGPDSFTFTADDGLLQSDPATVSITVTAVAEPANNGAAFPEFLDPNPNPGNRFGAYVVPLSTGNVVITSPGDDAGGTDAGAVYLYDGNTGLLISTLVGSTAGDLGFFGRVTTLSNGNYVVCSPGWDNGSATNSGAVTWGNGITGISGVVSASNSLVGSTTDDFVGDSGVTPLNNGNYLVVTYTWDSGAATDAGAVTWGNGSTGSSGVISASNSLVGSTTDDRVGSNGLTILGNGNYLVSSPGWHNGAAANAGAVTWGNGSTGISGAVGAGNSLVGSTAGDNVGAAAVTELSNGNYVVRSSLWDDGAKTDAGAATWGNGTTGITGAVGAGNSLVGNTAGDNVGSVTDLTNGNYVVSSPNWDNGAAANAGAVTLANGATGTSGVVSAVNSIVGSTAGDQVGSGFVYPLSNGNYVVRSPNWDNVFKNSAGAVTWCNGSTAASGVINATNSLVGSTAGDQVGSGGVIALSNGNYVVRSSNWDNGPVTDAGAATWGNGSTGTSGVVSGGNSLVGSTASDQVSSGFVDSLNNGNYVVRSPNWDNGIVTNGGAVTWGNGSTGTSGVVSAGNSLVGTTASDSVGSGGLVALTNGNYLVRSPTWDSGAIPNVGALTWGNGSAGTSGVVSSGNSLIGSTATDQVGSSVTVLSNGNYIVHSPTWDNGAATNVGAATWGNGNTGISGAVSAGNSLVGSAAGDQVGFYVTALANGNYIVRSSTWDNGAATDAGAMTWGNGSTGTSGVVSAGNSLVGSTAGDLVGNGGVTALGNGNYVVSNPTWDNGAATDAGAVTWGNGSTGTSGVVSAGNSLIGSTAGDNVGTSFSGMTALSNGNYLVRSQNWDNGAAADAGAVTWGNGITGTSGEVSAVNSMLGQSAGAGLYETVVDEINQTFTAGFIDEVSGKVRVGSQENGLSAVPFVTSPTSTAITGTTATLGGKVSAEPAVPITDRGVVYSLASVNPDPLVSGSGVTKVSTTGTTGAFTVPVAGLAVASTYKFKAYATNSFGTSYSNVATFTTLEPEIVVEHPAASGLSSGSASIALGAPAGSTSAGKVITIRNAGTADLTLAAPSVSGGNAGEFTVDATDMLLTLPPAGHTTFRIAFTPADAGARFTTLTITSDDADEAAFTISLTGITLLVTQDTDNDGLNDVAESNYASFGFDWQTAQPALVATLFAGANDATLFTTAQFDGNRTAGQNDVVNNPNAFSLYTLDQIQAINVGTPLLARDSGTGVFKLTIELKKNTELVNGSFQPFPFTAVGTTVNGNGNIQFQFTSPENAAFFRIEAR